MSSSHSPFYKILDAETASGGGPWTFTSGIRQFPRNRDEFGDLQIEWTPDTPPSTLTLKLQGRLTPDMPWSTVQTWTQAEVGASGGTLIARVPILPEMRVDGEQGAVDDVLTVVMG